MKGLFSIIASLITLVSSAQTITISSAKMLALGSIVTVKGIVTTGPELDVIRFMQDNTAGVAVYDVGLAAVQRGDSLLITGELTEFNNLLEISNVSNFQVLNSGNPLPAPKNIDLSTGFIEANEAQLVKVSQVNFTQSGNFGNSSTNYDITDGVNTKESRIIGSTDLAGTPIPGGKINLTGVLGQYLSTYQLQPRGVADIEIPGPKFVTQLIQTNIFQFSFTVGFQTENKGSTILRYGSTQSMSNIISDTAKTLSHSMDITSLNHGSIYYVQGISIDATGDSSFSAVQLMATRSLSPGDIKIYFNNPVDHSVSSGTPAKYLNQAFADTLIAFIGRAKNTLDIAIYNIDNDNLVISAINAAFSNGVAVRVIANEGMLQSNYDAIQVGPGNKKQSPSGIDYGIMHNKFIVIDANESNPNLPFVLTGSTNFTNNQLKTDRNNIVIIQDQALARAYTMEFDEMWNGDFGPDKLNNTPHLFNIGGREVELYFSPSDGVEDKIKQTISNADEQIYFAIMVWTRFNIAYDIESRIDAGVFAAGILNDTSGFGNLPYNVLIGKMQNTLFVDNQSGVMHHKYLLVDALSAQSDPLVLTGSHNWSNSANTRNDENTLIIHDEDITNQYYQEWVRRYRDNGGLIFVNIEPELNQSQLNIALFPNPASGYLNILWEEPYTEGVINIFDMQGRQFYSGILEIGKNGDKRINTSNWPIGIYTCRIGMGKAVKTVKVVISR